MSFPRNPREKSDDPLGDQLQATLYHNRQRRLARQFVWTPAQFFAASEAGVFYDLSDLSALWQDSNRTTPGVVDSPVGAVDDLSGNGNHALQATDAKRPILRTSGGIWYLEFDGSDDGLQALYTMAQPMDRISALRQISWASDQLFGGGNANAGVLIQNVATPRFDLYSGSFAAGNNGAAIGVNAVVTERHDGASSRLAVNNNSYTTGNANTNSSGGITLGASFGGAANSNIRLYGVVEIERALSDGEIAQARNYMATKAGVTI